MTHLTFNILSILLCSHRWHRQHRKSSQMFHFCLSLSPTDHSTTVKPFSQSLGLPLRSVSTCNYDDKHRDSWSRYKTSRWMNIFIQHVLSPEALCHGKMHSAEYFIFSSSLAVSNSKDGKSSIFDMNHNSCKYIQNGISEISAYLGWLWFYKTFDNISLFKWLAVSPAVTFCISYSCSYILAQ